MKMTQTSRTTTQNTTQKYITEAYALSTYAINATYALYIYFFPLKSSELRGCVVPSRDPNPVLGPLGTKIPILYDL